MKGKPKSRVEIVAECVTHGRFQVLRPLNKHQSEGGGKNDGRYCAVVCPVCRNWAKISSQRIVTEAPAQVLSVQGSLL
jgi:hypothetical protein